MKIEKISENQIKFMLTDQDLSERNMKINELAYGSQKAQELFREIMERASLECDFHTNNETALIIEAIPMKYSGIMVVVTKVAGQEELENRLGRASALAVEMINEEFFGGVPMNEQPIGLDFPIPAMPMPPQIPTPRKAAANPQSTQKDAPSHIIYAFKSFEQVVLAAVRISGTIRNSSTLFKHKEQYYLLVESERTKISAGHEGILREYGQKIGADSAKDISKMFLSEHGETIIKRNAINILAAYLA